MEQKRKHIEGKIEFDVLHDGVYQKRVSKGVLLEDDFLGCKMHLVGSNMTVFNATISLMRFIDENGLQEDFEKYKNLVDKDSLDIREANEAIDLLLKSMGLTEEFEKFCAEKGEK